MDEEEVDIYDQEIKDGVEDGEFVQWDDPIMDQV